MAGQQASLRGLDILTNLGIDVRILQMQGAKDPDEYVIKYGNGRFGQLVEEAISLVEFKVKMLKGSLNIEATNDKIKFLNEIAKLLGTITNKMEQEIYIEKISKEYKISKEAIYAEVNKQSYSKNKGSKLLAKNFKIKNSSETTEKKIDDLVLKTEEMVIALLVNETKKTYKKIKDKILPEDFKLEENKKIVTRLYEEIEKGNSNISNIINYFSEDEKIIGILTKVMADNYEIKDSEKAITDIINIYEKETLIQRKNEIINILKMEKIETEVEMKLLKELQDINIKLTQTK